LSEILIVSPSPHPQTLPVNRSETSQTVFESIFSSGSGPDDGQPQVISSYHSELGGFTSVGLYHS